jgi:3-dehydroquinate synthase
MKVSPMQVKAGLLLLFVMGLVGAPFVLWGESFVLPFFDTAASRTGGLVVIAVLLLTADAVAPVPATVVIMVLAAKAGWVAGVVGGTIGLSGGVLASAWIGRSAVGRIVPRLFPEAELVRLRTGLQQRLEVTLGCLRIVPVLAETSVIVAAATGIPVGRLFRATLLPNAIVATIYSAAARDSFGTAAGVFLATLAASYGFWRWRSRGSVP